MVDTPEDGTTAPRSGAAGGPATIDPYTPDWCDRLILRRTKGSLLVGFLAAVWCYLPVKEWPGLIRGKIWPSDEFIRANPQQFGDRMGYLQHLLKRTKDKT